MLLSYKWHLCLNLKKPFHHSLPLKILFFYNFNTIPLVAACWCFYPTEILYTAKQYKLKPVDKTALFSSASGSRHQGGNAVKRNKQHLCQPDLWFKVPTWLISRTLSVKPFLSLSLQNWWCSHTTHTPVVLLQSAPYWHPVNSVRTLRVFSETSYWWDHSEYLRSNFSPYCVWLWHLYLNSHYHFFVCEKVVIMHLYTIFWQELTPKLSKYSIGLENKHNVFFLVH